VVGAICRRNNKLNSGGHLSDVIGFIEGRIFTNLIGAPVAQQFGSRGKRTQQQQQRLGNKKTIAGHDLAAF